MMKSNPAHVAAETAERMHIAVADPRPVNKLDAEFEGRAGGGHKMGFIDTQPFVKGADMGNGCFTDANDADGLGFNEMNAAASGQQANQCRGRHPTSRPTAHDHDPQWRRRIAMLIYGGHSALSRPTIMGRLPA